MLDFFFTSLLAQSFWFGIISAIALPLGALMGIYLRPGKIVIAGIMSYGAGALISILAFELVLPSAKHSGFTPVAIGMVLGGLIFVVLNNTLNGQGAFLRKPATIIRHLIVFKRRSIRSMVKQLSRINVLRACSPDEIRGLIPFIRLRHFETGTVIFNQGEAGDSLYLIDNGQVDVLRSSNQISRLGPGESFGEMSLISGEPRNATLKSVTPVRAWQIMKDDFDWIVKNSPQLYDSLKKLHEERSVQTDAGSEAWSRSVVKDIGALSMSVSDRDIAEASQQTHAGGAAFAIWLGMLLDGIPEAAVVGASMIGSSVSLALVIGIFLANLPEAMSSAAGLRNQKVKITKILWMWGSLTIMSGFCSLLGLVAFRDASPFMFALFESTAAGAMLVVVAETMLPEAYQQGGSIVGISTLLGFLSGLLLNIVGK